MPTAGTLPWPTRVLLVAALVALGAVVLFAGSGALGRVAGSLGGTFAGLVGGLLPSPTRATPTPLPALVPRLDLPRDHYTNGQTATITGHLPTGLHGPPGATIRIYDNGRFVTSVPVGTTTDFVVTGLPLVEGDNELTATVTIGTVEGEPSDSISIVRDDVAPKITLQSPKDGLKTTAATVRVAGTTEAGAAVTIRDISSGGTTTVIADGQGAFGVDVTLVNGENDLSITATDPAGNSDSKTLTVTRNAGGVSATLTLSSRTVPGNGHGTLTMTVQVKDSRGQPVSGGTATFIVTPPNQGALVLPAQTIVGGSASQTTTLAQQAPGQGQVVVTVQLPDGRSATAIATFTVT